VAKAERGLKAMPDDTKIFDVAKPGRSAPSPTSRPIIPGHDTPGVDTMLSGNVSQPQSPTSPSTTPIHVAMADEEPVNVISQPGQPGHQPDGNRTNLNNVNFEPQESSRPPAGAPAPLHELDEQPQQPDESSGGGNFTPLSTLIPNSDSKSDTGEYGSHHIDKLPENHNGDPGWREAPPLPASKGAGPKSRWPKILAWLLMLLLITAAGMYLAIDDGLIKSNIKLPFHIFNKQKTSAPTVTKTTVVKTSPPQSPPPAESVVPAGFTAYTVAGSGANFAYPTTWGAPAVTKAPGFSKRGGTNKSDGTYAYIIDFATNKDVQLALTSSKYLPAADSKLYYQSLQWCLGTNDGKYYKQTLHFTTDSSKVDTPGTVSCDQGPLTDATKIDSASIVQLKTNAADTPTVQLPADLYTKNLDSKDIPVLHVRDKGMKSGDGIKKLLTTIKFSSSTSSSTTNSNSNSIPL
jgi:hypothetical protein